MKKIDINKIYQGDSLQVLKTFPDQSVDCIITSPPYWGLRDYGVKGQIGLEKTPEEFIQKLVLIFREAKRVLKNDGTCWINMGDSYVGTSSKGEYTDPKYKNGRNGQKIDLNNKVDGLKKKDLVGIPWMLAFALRADGWYLRQDIIWSKPNPMPESVSDRCTKSHEYIFLLSKSSKYYYDSESIKTPIKDASIARLAQDIENQKGSNRVPGKTNGTMKAVIKKPSGWATSENYKNQTPNSKKRFNSSMAAGGSKIGSHNGYFDKDGKLLCGSMANKKSVWEITTQPFREAHFATFPEALILPMIKAGSREKGIVLDPFMGSGTTGLVAMKLRRNYIGIELSKEYIKIANKRLSQKILI